MALNGPQARDGRRASTVSESSATPPAYLAAIDSVADSIDRVADDIIATWRRVAPSYVKASRPTIDELKADAKRLALFVLRRMAGQERFDDKRSRDEIRELGRSYFARRIPGSEFVLAHICAGDVTANHLMRAPALADHAGEHRAYEEWVRERIIFCMTQVHIASLDGYHDAREAAGDGEGSQERSG